LIWVKRSEVFSLRLSTFSESGRDKAMRDLTRSFEKVTLKANLSFFNKVYTRERRAMEPL
jgi:hypothetical protein